MACSQEALEGSGDGGRGGPRYLETGDVRATTRLPAERGSARPRAGARMMRRRRRAALLAAGFVAGSAFFVGGGPEGRAVASRPGAPRHVLIRPGQTLWDLAERYAPRGIDPRAYVDAVSDLNDLDGGLPAGVRLRLPR